MLKRKRGEQPPVKRRQPLFDSKHGKGTAPMNFKYVIQLGSDDKNFNVLAGTYPKQASNTNTEE